MTADEALNHPWIVHHHLDRISAVKTAKHQESLPIVSNGDDSYASFVEVVLDGAVSLHNESIVCGISCTPTSMHC